MINELFEKIKNSPVNSFTSTKIKKMGIDTIVCQLLTNNYYKDYTILELGGDCNDFVPGILEAFEKNGHTPSSTNYWAGTTESKEMSVMDSDFILPITYVSPYDNEDKHPAYLIRATCITPDFFACSELFLVVSKKVSEHFLMKNVVDVIVKAGHDYHKAKISKVGKLSNRLVLNDDIKEDVVGKIDEFISNKEFYKRHNLPHKLGILLYGPPGNGKTSFIKYIGDHYKTVAEPIDNFVDQGGNIHLPKALPTTTATGPSYGFNCLDAYSCYLAYRRQHEDVKEEDIAPPRVIYFEDMEKAIAGSDNSGASMRLSTFLNAVDGVEELDNVVIIGTTNDIKSLRDSITKRPGRFDVVKEIGIPDRDSVLSLFQYFDMDIEGGVDKYVDQLGGYSMAFVELFIKCCLFQSGSDVVSSEVADRAIGEIKQHCKSYDGGGGMGFGG